MKRKITFLIAAIAAIMLITQPVNLLGQKTPTTIWSEDFSGYSANDVPSGGTYSYSCTNGGGTTQIYEENLAGCTSPELLVAKTNGTFSAVIPLNNYSGDLTLKFYTNANNMSISTSSTGITIYGTSSFSSAGEHSVTFKGVTASTTDIAIEFKATNKNCRLDNILLTGTKVPAISADDVNITADILAGYITYNIINPDGSTMTATKKSGGDWFTLGAVDAENNRVAFTSTENYGDLRSAVVTLTYGTATKDVTVTQAAAAPKYAVTFSAPSNGTLVVKRGETPISSGDEITSGTILTIVATPNDGYNFDKWEYSTNDGSTWSNGVGTTYEVTSTVQLRASFIAKVYHTITYVVNGVDNSVNVEEGEFIDLSAPESALIPVGYVFKGWRTSTLDPTDTDPDDYVTSATSTTNTTYYAVVAETSISNPTLAKLGSDATFSTNDNIVIVAKGTTYALYQETTNTSYVKNWTFDNDVSTVSADSRKYLTMSNKESEWYLGDDTNGYLYGTGGGNELYVNNNKASWTIAWNNTQEAFTIKVSTRYLSCRTDLSTINANLYRLGGTGTSTGSAFFDIYKYIPSVVITKNYCTTVSSVSLDEDVTITGDLNVTYTLIVTSGNTLTVSGTLTNTDPANLVIEDGGQLITSSSVQLTYKKNITSAAKDGGWYTISTPVHTASNTFLTPGSVENLILDPATNYDFFYYDEASHTWMNYKQSAFNLNIGQGYLYRNNGAELHFAGYSNQATYYEKALSYASTEDKLKGFNLIGNPYPQNITMSDVTVNNEGALSGGYVLSESGAWSADVAATIAPTQGFLVQIDKTGVTARITKPAGGAKSRSDRDYLKFIVANSQYEDAAFALFEEGYGLNKIDHRNSDIPMLYIPKDRDIFAIATMDNSTQSFNLNFKAKTTGKYTLSYEATGEYSYLHVIDRLTGEDVDMLLEGEYSFIASPNDNENRFIVNMRHSNNAENSENSIFAYQNGNDIVVNGEGELQIFDVMGRMVGSQRINGVQTINIPLRGVYIFRLNEKTQKIVVE